MQQEPGTGRLRRSPELGRGKTGNVRGLCATTNNRMELMGCIKGLESLEGPCSVTVCSDSQYVVNGIAKGWAERWKSNNWMLNKDEAAENSDLWTRRLDLCEKHDVQFH